jgi:formylglycine-generating enzyme required for sulfatase activity
MSQAGAADRSITVGRDANNCVITSGNGNIVTIYQTVAAVATTLPGGKNPFLGLLAFTETDADRFFGRDKLVKNLWERFRDLIGSPPADQTARLLAILGPSGSGKSSLARAGLVPELARRPVSQRQQPAAKQGVATMTPGVHPLQALALLLAKVATNNPVEAIRTKDEFFKLLQSTGGQAPTGLRQIAGSLCAEHGPLVLLIDQFEEIYSLCEDAAERKGFTDNLLDAASDPAGFLSVIVTLRSDFLGATQGDSRLNQVIAGQSVIVPAMSPEELRSAIAEPAKRAGYPIDEDTIQRLIAETAGRDGALPLLQFVLVRIWEGMVAGVTAAKTVADLGGVGGALGAEAERIYLKLNAGDEVIAQRAFLAMVQFNENQRPTRHRAYLSQLVTDGDGPSQAQALERVHGVVNAFAQWDTRLVTMAATPQGDQTTVEVSHEAIFEHWDRLRHWLADGMDDIRLHLRVAEAAKLWDDKDRPKGSLWRPPDLDLLRDLTSSPTISLSSIEKAFFRTSDQARRRRLIGSAVAVMLALSFLIGWLKQDVLRDQYTWHIDMRAPIFMAGARELAAQPTGFTDCEKGCPQMTVLQGGTFTMGSEDPPTTEEIYSIPLHRITIAKPFAVSKTQVTFEQWDACVKAGGCRHPLHEPLVGDAKRDWGQGDYPVIYVGWPDAVAYTKWLSRLSGKDYRLLSEAEWEYAARAGSSARYSFGNDESKLEQYAWFKGNSGNKTHAVGQKPANAFGLQDMPGNVEEWVEDPLHVEEQLVDPQHNDYRGAPIDGTAWRLKGTDQDPLRRIIRGGSFQDDADKFRSASRGAGTADGRGYGYVGFRVARTL